MARIKLVEQNEATGAERERYDELAGRNAVTNMKKGLLNDAATYDAYMAWYTSWNRLVEVIGEGCHLVRTQDLNHKFLPAVLTVFHQ